MFILNRNSLFFTAILLSYLIYLRYPVFFSEPRIWAEDGSVHIQSFLDYGVDSLYLPHLGYFSLFNNSLTYFAMSFGGLQNSALIVTYITAFFTLIISLTPFVFSSHYWPNTAYKSYISLMIILLGSSESWLNMVNMQFYFCVYSCLYLLSDNTESKYKVLNIYKRCMFFLACFTGITSVALLPFFVRKFVKKNESKTTLYCILSVLIVHFYALLNLGFNGLKQSRFDVNNLIDVPPALLEALIYNIKANYFYHNIFIYLSVVLALILLYFLYLGIRKEFYS